MHQRHFHLLLGLLAMLVCGRSVHAQQRGRPIVDTSLGHRIILTDEGTLLRGVSLAWDGGDPHGSLPKVVPTAAQLRSLAEDFGLNTVHLYLEGNSSQNSDPLGVNLADADAFVQATAEAGLYLIITIGCNGENGGIHSLDFALDFWMLYGLRYRNRTHVIYEAHNEPALHTPNQWTIEDWDRQVALYQLMRQVAPNTLILLGSFMGFAGDPSFGAEYLAGRGVSWDNAGFAHHGYESKAGIENAIAIMQSDPDFPPLLCTEFWPGDTEGQGYNGMYESRINGWMQFQWLGADDEDLNLFRSKITSAGTIWTPDSPAARWPALGSPTNPEDGSLVGLFQRKRGRFVGVSTGAGGRLRADRGTYTGGVAGDGFFVEHVGARWFRLRSRGGGYVHSPGEGVPLRADGESVEEATIFEWIQLPNRDHAIRAVSAGGHLVRWDSRTDELLPDADDGRDRASHFSLVTEVGEMPAPLPGDPFHGTPHVVPGRIEAEDYDLGGEGVSYLDLEPANNGDRYRTLEGVDIEDTLDEGGGYNVGWIGPGEWIVYTIEVPGDRTVELDVNVRVSAPGAGARFGLRFDGEDRSGTFVVPATGGYQQWTTITRRIALEPGVRSMRFENRGTGVFNLNWFEFLSRPCPADFNGDGRVDGADLPMVLGSWGVCTGPCPTDVNDDGIVDGGDLSAVLGDWGVCP